MSKNAVVHPMPAPRRGRIEGFTLIEVVVAMAILGAGLVILLETHYASLSLFDDAQSQAMMRMFLERAIGTAENDVMAGNATGDGDFGKRSPDFSFSFTSNQVNETDMPGLFEVTVTVNGPEEQQEMSFFIYDGKQSESPAQKSQTPRKVK